MGITKRELFTEHQNNLAQVAKALAHPARIAIIEHLLRVNTCIGGELVDHLPLAQPTISQHLRELKEAGIIQGTIDGVKINYCINAQRWREIARLFGDFLATPVIEQGCC
ncbi:MAG: winged helix-turn-helix transcriptional regulator [Lewinellaceae bacterium]|nr:winged helix-turn-helix transcriptional regulator [Lewinellaceae bacterium]